MLDDKMLSRRRETVLCVGRELKPIFGVEGPLRAPPGAPHSHARAERGRPGLSRVRPRANYLTVTVLNSTSALLTCALAPPGVP